MVSNLKERVPSIVIEKLYLGGLFDANRKETLQNTLGIKYILKVGRNLISNFPKVFDKKLKGF